MDQTKPTSSLKHLSIAAVLAVVFGLCAISNESFWIDELMSAYLVTADSSDEYNQRVDTLNTSDIQMPVFVLYTWAWEKASGEGERAMRLSNLLWFVIGVVGLKWYLRDQKRLGSIAALLVLISPFAWFYLNELRPYAMLLGASCLVFGCSARLILGWKKNVTFTAVDIWLAAFGIIVMSGATLLGVPWAGVFILLIVIGVVQRAFHYSKAQLMGAATVTGIALAALSAYYLTTLDKGARAATFSGNPIVSFGFAFYELLGFAGLGPGRTELRQQGIGVFTLPQLIALAGLGITMLIIGVAYFRRQILVKRGEGLWQWAVLFVPPLLFMVAFSILKDFRAVGRHLTPYMPVLAIFLAMGILSFRNRRNQMLAGGALAVFLLISAVSLRLAERHRKEDYRAAANIVKQETAKGETVLWSASLSANPFYKLNETGISRIPAFPGSNEPVPGSVFLYGRPTGSRLSPSKILISKPDIHDQTGFAAKFAQDNGYKLEQKFAGFEVWSR